MQGGPLMHVIAAKAVAFKNAATSEFKKRQKQTIKNSQALSDELKRLGYYIVSGGTDNHLMLVDLIKSRNVTGKSAAISLDDARITVNKNLIPFDPETPVVTSGIRVGTPAVTTRGMKEEEMKKIAQLIDQAIVNKDNKEKLVEVREEVEGLTKAFPIYKDLV